MLKSDFYYELPDELIAQYPLDKRAASRLLCLNRLNQTIADSTFETIVDKLHPGDLLVLNDTRVIKARLYGKKASGGRVEILVERVLNERECLVHMRVSKKPKIADYIYIDDIPAFQLIAREADLFHLRYTQDDDIWLFMEQKGHLPLPPYIVREDSVLDESRYQTVYAKNDGAVAAPTAGLHFDQSTIKKLQDKGVAIAYVTLHVGAGTFQPVKVDAVCDHKMHKEVFVVTEDTAAAIKQTKQSGGRVIAVGTTVVRALESASQLGDCQAYQGETGIFIYPGYHFRTVDGMLTNFHLPESTLIMLVAAFAGYEFTMSCYKHAVDAKYRFFSYGDAMFIE